MRRSVGFGWAALGIAAGAALLVAAAVGQQGPGAGGRRGFGGNAVFGVVGSVDYNLGVIGIQGQNGQQTWVAVTADTQLMRTAEASAQDLQVGETVTVIGQPTAITAADVRIGEQGMGLGGPGGPAGGAQGAGAGPAGRRGFQGTAQVTGQITGTDPLIVTTQDGTPVQVTLAENARFSRTVPATIQNIVIGDQVMAFGQAAQDGYYYARVVRIGAFRGFGGFGRRGAGGPPQGQ